jgi:hypothetical protein
MGSGSSRNASRSASRNASHVASPDAGAFVGGHGAPVGPPPLYRNARDNTIPEENSAHSVSANMIGDSSEAALPQYEDVLEQDIASGMSPYSSVSRLAPMQQSYDSYTSRGEFRRSSAHSLADGGYPETFDVQRDLEGVTSLLDTAGCETLLVQYAAQIFIKADRGQSGYLDEEDFCMLVQSPTLNLNITSVQAKSMLQRAALSCGDRITFEEFMPVMRELFLRHSQVQRERNNAGWQWFGLHFDDPASLPAYYNTVHGIMTYDRPPLFVEKKCETQTFQQLRVKSQGKVWAPIDKN